MNIVLTQIIGCLLSMIREFQISDCQTMRIFERQQGEVLETETVLKNVMPAHLGSFCK